MCCEDKQDNLYKVFRKLNICNSALLLQILFFLVIITVKVFILKEKKQGL